MARLDPYLCEYRNERKNRFIWFGFAFIVLAAIVLLYFAWSGAFDSRTLPSLEEISAIQVYYEPREEVFRFALPRERWPEILDALTPAEKDDHPCKWCAIRELAITKRSGRPIIVDLYTLSKPPGAFSIRSYWWKVYYRGGDSVKLNAALQKVYKASRG
jgi:hypothetical protein